MTIFEFIGQFQFLTPTSFLRTWKILGIYFFLQIWDHASAKKILTTFLKTSLKIQRNHASLIFRKNFVISFRSHLIREFLVFLEDSLNCIVLVAILGSLLFHYEYYTYLESPTKSPCPQQIYTNDMCNLWPLVGIECRFFF
jgi:hypothetical protein